MITKKHSCTIFFAPEKQIKPRKYRYVNKLSTFLHFANKAGAWYVNVYDRETGLFLRREYLPGASSPGKISP